jgi:hypothetical protein
MSRKAAFNIILLFIFLDPSGAQEIVIGLQSNPHLKYATVKFEESKGMASDTLSLPFYDDFSGHDIFPDNKKWSDNFVLINNNYSNRQITTGVATFDALDNTGSLYETATSAVSVADYLTSQPLDLNFPASDNIWLTFYFQPGGLGDAPEPTDSLAIQFFAPSEKKWYPVWHIAGNASSVFRLGQIKITDSKFLKKGFRFRFLNYISLSPNTSDPSMISNCDQWNIDYLVLDRNRDEADTVFADVAFRYPNRSLLKTHEAMPWRQFRQVYLQEMASTVTIHYRNNDTADRNVTRNFEIWDVYKNSLAKSFTAGATNIEGLMNVDFPAGLIYTYNTDNTDSALFRVKSWLITDSFDPKENDTTIYFQRFNNYFAFDDGSAEAGYGINGLGSRNAMVAYRFRSFMKDTVRAIRICFNDSFMNTNRRSFDLMVWDDVDGLPGNILHTREEAMVEPGDSINGFHTYLLPEAVPVDGVFYVGWRQRTETFLNAGLDINTPSAGKQLYSISGTWMQSQIKGSLMIRPVVGAPIATSINDIAYRNKPKLHFWPNPAQDYISIDTEEVHYAGPAYLSIFDIRGRELIRIPVSDRIDISSLHEGIYIIVSSRNGVPTGYNRLVKTK